MPSELKDKYLSKRAHSDLLLADKPVFQNLKTKDESVDYKFFEFTITNDSVKFRVGKIIPTKVGQFVTL